MKNYIVKLQNNEYVSGLLFSHAVFKASSCKQLAKQLKQLANADDYELRYLRSMNMFVLRLLFNYKYRSILVTYNIYTMNNL